MSWVKISDAGLTVPSAVLLLLSPIETLAVGCWFKTTVKVAVPAVSVVTRPLVGVTVMPATA